MKNYKKTNQGFIIPLLVIIVALILIGGGTYIYKENHPSANVNGGLYNQTDVNSSGSDYTTVPPNPSPNPGPGPIPLAVDTGIKGTATIGPTCPTVQVNGNGCADKPYQTTLQLLSENNAYIQAINVGVDGKFSIEVAPGKYKIALSSNAAIYPKMSDPGIIVVVAHQYTNVNLQFDSGIR